MSQKLGAVIYLRTRTALQLADFASAFRRDWPEVPLQNEGHSGNVAYFGVGKSHVEVGFFHGKVPPAITESAFPCRHWSNAEKELADHLAYLKIAVPVEADGLSSSVELTRVIVSLLAVTEAIGVCWLNATVENGSILNATTDFVGIAREMLGGNLPPLMLWVAARWKPEDHVIHTAGMLQLGASEIFLGLQPQLTRETGEYLFEVAYYVLTCEKEFHAGDTMEGPQGLMRVELLSGKDPNKKGLLLVPVRPN